jgi:hypothetical protein
LAARRKFGHSVPQAGHANSSRSFLWSDMASDSEYDRYVLKKYEHFSLFLAQDQHYLGQAYAWLNRPGTMQRYSQLTAEEMVGLQKIAKEYEDVLERLWSPDT